MLIMLYIVAALAVLGVIIRPWNIPDSVFAVAGAVVMMLLGIISPGTAWAGVKRGTDVYLFLTGMMLLAETAREEKLFEWLAAHATRFARGSPRRLYVLIYGVGVVVTTFLSNDATAVVLTPAVAAAAGAAGIRKPLPYLFICAFVANAASFVLPISNPANLVLYGSHMPSLGNWFSLFGVPSVVSITATGAVLFFSQRRSIRQPMKVDITSPVLSAGGKTALWGIVGTAFVLLTVSALDRPLGLPTAIAGALTTGIVLLRARHSPLAVIKGVNWSVMPLVAGLFVIVEALDHAGVVAALGRYLGGTAAQRPMAAFWGSSIGIGVFTNLANNLPVGLVAAGAVRVTALPAVIHSGILIGVDLGPNLSVTGSLATILWLTALRRENITVSGGQFLKLGCWVMLPVLMLTLVALWWMSLI